MGIYAICIDRLEIIFNCLTYPDNLKEYEDSEVKFIEDNKHKSPNYRKCFNVLIDDVELGRLYLFHKGKYQYSITNPAHLIINNRSLYSDNLTDKIKILTERLSLNFYKFKQVDIALDGKELVTLHDKLMKSKVYRRKSSPKTPISIRYDEGRSKVVGFTVGSIHSDKYLVFYQKSEEIKLSEKHYIIDYWLLNGLDADNSEIGRLELRLKKKMLDVMNENYQQFNDPVFLASIFRKEVGKYLEFTNTKNKKVKQLIDWNKLENVTISRVKKIRKSTSPKAMKPVIKKLFIEYRETSLSYYRLSYMKLANDYKLVRWLESKQIEW